MADESREDHSGVSRRKFLQGAGAAAATTALLSRPGATAAESVEPVAATPGIRRFAATGQTISLGINGSEKSVVVTPATTLLQALREMLGLTGAKEVCDRGACGACTVLLDGHSVNSCMLLAIDAMGHSITTIEGLGRQGQLDPIQAAFVENDACQCGYCIPGFILRSRAMLDETPRLNHNEIKQGLCGNICRCAAYAAIFAAVEKASQGGAP